MFAYKICLNSKNMVFPPNPYHQLQPANVLYLKVLRDLPLVQNRRTTHFTVHPWQASFSNKCEAVPLLSFDAQLLVTTAVKQAQAKQMFLRLAAVTKEIFQRYTFRPPVTPTTLHDTSSVTQHTIIKKIKKLLRCHKWRRKKGAHFKLKFQFAGKIWPRPLSRNFPNQLIQLHNRGVQGHTLGHLKYYRKSSLLVHFARQRNSMVFAKPFQVIHWRAWNVDICEDGTIFVFPFHPPEFQLGAFTGVVRFNGT